MLKNNQFIYSISPMSSQMTEFQAPSINTFWDISLTFLIMPKFSKGHNSKNINRFYSKVYHLFTHHFSQADKVSNP